MISKDALLKLAQVWVSTTMGRDAVINGLYGDLEKVVTRDDITAAVDLALKQKESRPKHLAAPSPRVPSAVALKTADPDFDPYPQGEFPERAESTTSVAAHPAIV